jgi:hypothetical protein
MASLWAGYHVIEDRLLKNLDAEGPHISMLEFFRRISDARIQGMVLVYKLNEGTQIWDDPEDFARNLRRRLKSVVEYMIHRSCTIIFVVNDGSIIGEERPILAPAGLNLAKIFGADRLERVSEGHLYSTFNVP